MLICKRISIPSGLLTSIFVSANATDGNRDRALELQDSANMKRYLAQGLGVAAIACAGVSVVLFLRGGGHEESPTALRIAPHADHQQAGLTLWGAW